MCIIQKLTKSFSDSCKPGPEILKIQRDVNSVKFSDVSLAQKSSRFKRDLSVMFGDVNESGTVMPGSTKGALSLTKKVQVLAAVNVNPAQKFSRIQGTLSVKSTNVSLAQKFSREIIGDVW